MCGIVGYVGLGFDPDGNKFDHNAYDVVLEGLRRQEYRGYDSAGVALVCPDGIEFRKKAGKLLNLENEVKEHPCRNPRLVSVTPVGQPTVDPPTSTLTPTLLTTAASPSSTTVLSKTLQNCVLSCSPRAWSSPLRLTPR